MTTSSRQSAARARRVSRGVSEGGQFTTAERREARVRLADAQLDTQPDADGFPTVECAHCSGTGRAKFNRDAGHDRCFVCDGSGRRHPRGPVQDAVAAFARARASAARPKAWQVRAGDEVSPVYAEYGKAQWGRVQKVLVARARPVRFEGEGAARKPVAWPALVVLEDGRQLRVTTDTVLARRGAHVDPAPFVARALGGVEA